MTATFLPWFAVRTWLIKVVFPAPRNPVTIVTGTREPLLLLYAILHGQWLNAFDASAGAKVELSRSRDWRLKARMDGWQF